MSRRSIWATPYPILACLATVAVADLVIWQVHLPYLVEALFDEPAHAATGLLALLAVCVAPNAWLVAAVLAGSVLIDLDHVPHVFGSSVLEHGVPRPYPHALITLVLIAAIAIPLRDRWRRALVLVVCAAVGVHLIRDMAEPGGPGVALLWPLSAHHDGVSYGPYGIALLVLAVVGIARRRALASPAADPA